MSFLLLLLSLLFPNFNSEFECLTEAIYYEAGNQSNLGKLSVALVIENRVQHRSWPDSFCAVIRQDNQFSYYWDGKPEHIPRKNNKFERQAVTESKIIAWTVLVLPIEDLTKGSLYYHSTKIKPPVWTSTLVRTKKVGQHILYANSE